MLTCVWLFIDIMKKRSEEYFVNWRSRTTQLEKVNFGEKQNEVHDRCMLGVNMAIETRA